MLSRGVLAAQGCVGQPSDHPEELDRKVTAAAAQAAAVLICTVGFVSAIRRTDSGPPSFFAAGLAAGIGFAQVVAIARAALTHTLPACAVNLWLFTTAVGVLFADYATLGTIDLWTLIVLIMDGFLVFGGTSGPAKLVLVLTLAYLTFRSAEESVSVGLWESVPNSQRYQEAARPTMGVSSGITTGSIRVAVFMLDFVITRGFAITLRQQMEIVRSSAEVAESVAVLLSRYEVKAAQCVVADRANALPPALKQAFETLLANLNSYRPYLPQSCLPGGGSDGEEEEGEEEDGSASGSMRDEDGTSESGDRDRRARSSLSSVVSSASNSMVRKNTDRTIRSGVRSMASGVRADSLEDAAALERLRSRPTSVATNEDTVLVEVASARLPGALSSLPRTKNCSLLSVNRVSFLQGIEHLAPSMVAQWICSNVVFISEIVQQRKGIVEAVGGDHCLASFGCARVNASHRASAARVGHAITNRLSTSPRSLLTPLDGLAVRITAASGQALCGDFGSDVLRRFMVIGRLPSFLSVFDRFAARRREPLLVDECIRADVDDWWHLRLVAVVYLRKASRQPTAVWEISGARERKMEKDAAEWMYDLASLGHNKWVQYNEILKMWLTAEDIDVVAEQLRTLSASDADAAVREAGNEVLGSISNSTRAPVFAIADHKWDHVTLVELKQMAQRARQDVADDAEWKLNTSAREKRLKTRERRYVSAGIAAGQHSGDLDLDSPKRMPRSFGGTVVVGDGLSRQHSNQASPGIDSLAASSHLITPT